MSDQPNWKMVTYLLGGAAGLLTGLAAAFLIIRQREQYGGTLKLSSGDGAKIGMGVVTLLRTVADSGRK